MDMHEPFISAVREALPDGASKVAFDKYRVAAHLGDAVNRVRREEHKALMRRGDERLKGTRFLWLRNPEKMAEETWSCRQRRSLRSWPGALAPQQEQRPLCQAGATSMTSVSSSNSAPRTRRCSIPRRRRRSVVKRMPGCSIPRDRFASSNCRHETCADAAARVSQMTAISGGLWSVGV